MRSNLFAPENQEQESGQPGLRLQNSKMLTIELDGEALTRQGSISFAGRGLVIVAPCEEQPPSAIAGSAAVTRAASVGSPGSSGDVGGGCAPRTRPEAPA